VGDAAEAYENMMDDEKLEYDDKELDCAISKQVSLVTAQHYLNNLQLILMKRMLDWP